MEKIEESVNISAEPKISYEYKGKTYDDKDMVAYFKHENYLHKLENKLLGEYDEKGKYIFSKDIARDLVLLRKQILLKDKQTYLLKSVCGEQIFEFKLEIGVASKGKAYAQLYLIEKAYNIIGDEKIDVKTPIVFYTDDSDIYFEGKVKKIFNIYEGDEVEGRMKENETLALALLEKMKFWGKIYERYLLESRLRDKIYIEKILRILSQDKNVGAVALKKYEELIKKYEKVLTPANKNYYRVLKQLLDSVLIEEEQNTSKEVALLIQRLRKVYIQANEQTIGMLEEKPVKQTSKPEIKKSEEKSGAKTFKGATSVKPVKKEVSKNAFSSPYTKLKSYSKQDKQITNSKNYTSKKPVNDFNTSFMQTEEFNNYVTKAYEKANNTKNTPAIEIATSTTIDIVKENTLQQ